jgi:transposase, IS30 family
MLHSKITPDERDRIAGLVAGGRSVRSIARELNRSPSSVSRELKRNGSKGAYSAILAQKKSEFRNKASRRLNPLKDPKIYTYVLDKLRCGWSPEQIAGRLKRERGKRLICHETIYRYIYSSPDGKHRKLFEYLPRRQPKRYTWKGRSVYHKGIQSRVSIHDRPEVINQKKQFGHWEFDVVEGKAHQAGMVTALERVSRYYTAELIPAIDSEYGVRAQLKILRPLPRFARKTATFDNGKENYNHTKLRTELQMDTYFCDPHCAWQKGSNENHNGVLRRYIPKKTDLTQLTQFELNEITEEINNRPRKCLNYAKPKEVFKVYLGTKRNLKCCDRD